MCTAAPLSLLCVPSGLRNIISAKDLDPYSLSNLTVSSSPADDRSFHKGDIVSSSRVIVGVDAAIADAASLALMVESVGQGTDQWKDAIKRYRSVQTDSHFSCVLYRISLNV
jgi:hypothetical protein